MQQLLAWCWLSRSFTKRSPRSCWLCCIHMWCASPNGGQRWSWL